MGLVSQDHALFGTSIKENILFGKPDATMDELYAAAMTANAHNFIRGLPEGYETKVCLFIIRKQTFKRLNSLS
jgi:ATP-binding cassette subfamily B (MDR/TAP) protein 1